MKFRMLGALEVSRDGQPLSLAGAKPKGVLAILLLHANEIVSSDRLVEDLWGRPPDTARAALQVYVAQLRKLLEPGRVRGDPGRILLTRAPGYMLCVEPDQLDSERFERLLAEARAVRAQGATAVASELLGQALSLWRGPALADFAYEPFAQAEIARLEELHVAALEERLDVDLARGAHANLIGELELLVRKHPLRERLRGQLMLALYRAGRQADALEAYQSAHRTLDEQLGIAPSPALQRIQQQILRQDPALEAPEEPVREPPVSDVVPAAREARKTVTVIVAGRAAQAGMDPEALRQLDARHREAAAQAIGRHGGSVHSMLADRVVGVFGIPRVHEDDALRAARAGVELLEARAGEPELDDDRAERSAARIGIATGEVVTGESEAAGPSLAGEPLAIAAELEDAAVAGQILLADGTRGLLGDRISAEPLERAHGAAWRLLELIPAPPPLSRPPRALIVGRAGELASLRQALDRVAREGTMYLETVIGAAGIGKTRLAEEFVSGVADEASVVAGRCVPYGQGITFWPLREVVGRLTAATPLPELLAGQADAELVVERVTEAIGLTEASSSVEEIFWAFRRLLEAVSRRRPLVLLIEDVHWAEPTLLDFIDYVAERGRSPVLILCLARPELLEARPGWGHGKRSVSALALEPLSDAESEQLVDRLATGIPKVTRARVLDTAEGNPLFLEQMLAMLAEEAASEGEVLLPPTIQAVLAARLDRLGPGERTAIDTAAVIGKEFSERAVADLIPEDARPFASRHLDSLVNKELLQPAPSSVGGGPGFRFRHVLIQQAAYRMIPKRLRATLHARVAAWLEESIGRGTAEHAERAGYHLEQTYRYRAELGPLTDEDRELAGRAAGLLASAGRRAFRRGDMPASANLLERATSLLSSDDRTALELLPDLGYALFEVGELERANSALSEAIERARACDARGVEWNATVKLANTRMYTNPERMDPETLVPEARTAIGVLTELRDDLGLARAWSLLSEAEWVRGRMAVAAAASERAAVHAHRAGSPREESWGLGAWAMALLYGPTPAAEGIRKTQRLLREAAGNLVLEANLSGFLASHEAMGGRMEDARSHIAQSCERLHDLGLKWQAGVQELLGGHIEMFAGDAVAADRHMRAAKESFIAIGDRWFLSTVAVDLPRPAFELGRYADARSLVEAIDEVPAPADAEWQIKRRAIRARLLATEGEFGEAERLAREGVAAAVGTDLLWFHADALIDLAEVLKLASRFRQAAEAASGALALYERKGIVASAARTRAMLEDLRAASVGGS